MRSHSLSPLVLACLACSAAPAGAVMCTLDDVPAATLLLPYFEVADAPGVTTLFSLNNAQDHAALAHVTLWTDWSQPTAEFDVYLTGYDVVTVNLRDVVTSGFIPITADLASDTADTISPQGPFSQDASFTNCNLFFPLYSNPVLQGNRFERVNYGHRGEPVPYLGGRCLGAPHGDGVARGYLTIDSVSQCNTAIAVDPGYFVPAGAGVANDDNVLWGDYYLVDPSSGVAFGERMVSIEADPAFDATSTPTGYTFYGRYTFPTGADNREPLGTVWASRVLAGIGRSDLIVWRDSTDGSTPTNGYTCAGGPVWAPLNEMEVFFFDEQENATELCNPPGGGPIHSPPAGGPLDLACFPLETGRYQVDVGNLAVPGGFGWLYLDLNLPSDITAGDADFGSSGLIAQSYVAEAHTAGTIQVGLGSLELSSACVDEVPLIDP